jgi:hypothetical protein
MKLIALLGPKRSGKSEVAKILGLSGFSNIKFAQPLKDMILSLPGITLAYVETGLKDEPCSVFNGKTPRHAMQTLGTEWGRNCISEDIWLSLWRRRVEGLPLVTVDDCRFQNETEAVRAMGGVVWEVRREPCCYEGHSSETEMSKIKADAVIENNSTLYDLKITVNSMLVDMDLNEGEDSFHSLPMWDGADIEPKPRKSSRVPEGSDA